MFWIVILFKKINLFLAFLGKWYNNTKSNFSEVINNIASKIIYVSRFHEISTCTLWWLKFLRTRKGTIRPQIYKISLRFIMLCLLVIFLSVTFVYNIRKISKILKVHYWCKYIETGMCFCLHIHFCTLLWFKSHFVKVNAIFVFL